MAQSISSAPLDDHAVTTLFEELKEGLPDLIGDEEQVTAIAEQWDAHEDLAGKTKAQILKLLFADLKSVIKDRQDLDKIWAEWQGAEPENKLVVAAPAQPPTQPQVYATQMTENIARLNDVKTSTELAALSLQFEKISSAQKTEWLPFYYAAYALVMQSYQEKDIKVMDELMNRSDTLLAKADSLSQRNSEIFLLMGMSTQARMSADQSRYMTLGSKITKLVKQAEQLNPENPRAYFIDAQMTYYTPENFGGGKAKGIDLMKLAINKFDTIKPESSLSPSCGRDSAVKTLESWMK